MVTRTYKLHFEFTDETYAKYEAWCKEHHLDGYHGAIGGSHAFTIIPTSIGDVIQATAKVPLHDEEGNISYDEHGKARMKTVTLDLSADF